MKKSPRQILLVEDNVAEAELLQELLGEVHGTQFNLTTVNRVQKALTCLEREDFDVILLDLHLPDSQGLETVTKVRGKSPTVPILVLTVLNDENIALEAVRQGAQDYLIKGQLDTTLLTRAINYAIERQQVAEKLRQQAQREKLLAKIAEKIHQSLDLKDILQTTVMEVRQFFCTDRVLISNCASDGSGVVVVESLAANGTKERCIWNPEVTAALGIFESISSDSAAIMQETSNIAVAQNPMHLSSDFLLNQGVIAVPIWQSKYLMFHGQNHVTKGQKDLIDNKLWGMLSAHHYSSTRQWQKWEVDFLHDLANQVAIAIQQSELLHQLEIANRELQRIANTDGLTGVPNRRQFDQFLNQEWRRLTRTKQPLSLILCDIDYFKLYNDNYGHVAGNSCLRTVAQSIAAAVQRPGDLVARYGGEEFAVILPATDLLGAIFVAHKIRRYLQNAQLIHPQSSVNKYVTLSIGVATTIPDQNRYPESLVKSADVAMYKAKEQGRDRICQAE